MKSFLKYIKDVREKTEEDCEIPEIGFTYDKEKGKFQFCLMDLDGNIIDDAEDNEIDEAIKKGQ